MERFSFLIPNVCMYNVKLLVYSILILYFLGVLKLLKMIK